MSSTRIEEGGAVKVSQIGLAEEFLAALEAATGEEQSANWTDPMTGKDIGEVIDRLLVTARPDRGLQILVRSGVMAAVLPEIQAMVGFGEGVRHKDVWLHTQTVVLRTPATPVLRWSALFHDIGKVATRRFEANGQVTFFGHPELGARMFDRVAMRLDLANGLRQRVRFLIACHLRASAYDGSWTDTAVRRFAVDMGDALDDLLELSRSDITSKYEEKVQRGIRLIDELATRISEIRRQDAIPRPLPKGLGDALMARFNIAPGPALGQLMRVLAEAVDASTLPIQGLPDVYLQYVQDHGLLRADE